MSSFHLRGCSFDNPSYRHLQGQASHRDYDVMPNLSAFNLIVSSFANRIKGGGVMVGRNRYFFPTAADPFDLKGGLEAWKGFYSSVRPAHKQLMVNVNGAPSWT